MHMAMQHYLTNCYTGFYCKPFSYIDLIKPSNSLPTDILANGDMKALLTDTNGSENTQNGTEAQLKQNTQGLSTSSNNVSMEYV